MERGSRRDSPAPALVGREREGAALREALAAALAGDGSLLLIGGEAGIGKTTLAEALCAEAAGRGALVLVGRCYDLAETPPYGPWIEALARAARDPALPAPPDLAAGGGQTSQAALFAQVRDYLAALAAPPDPQRRVPPSAIRPLVLFLDDLHWADPASLDLLRALARGLADLPCLLLVTYRSDELTRRHPLYALLPTLVREARAARLDLRPLGDDGLRALVAARYPLPDADAGRLVAYLRERAEGNAFYTGELLRALEEAGALHPASRPAASGDAPGWALGDLAGVGVPPLLRQVIDARLDRLGEDARARLATAAVIGQVVSLDLWAAVAGADEGELLDTLERAVEARVLAGTDDGARFAHALIREALYEGILPVRRRQVHLRASAALAATEQPDPDAVAYHLRLAGDARAAEWLIKAGERAWRAHAWLSAAERYEAALTLFEAAGADAVRRAELLITLAQLRRYSATKQAVANLEEAARLATEAGDSTLAACAQFDQGHLRTQTGDFRRGIDEMSALLPVLEGLPTPERARLPTLRILSAGQEEPYHRGALVIHLANTGRLAEAVALSAPLPASGPGATGRGLLGLGLAFAHAGRSADAQRTFAAARAAFRAADQLVEIYRTFTYELSSVALPYLADRPALWEPLASEADALSALVSLAQPSITTGWAACPLLLLRGAWDAARRLAPFYVWSWVGGTLARYQGDAPPAWAVVQRCLPQGPATEPGGSYLLNGLPAQQLAATLALDAGDLPLARAWLAAHDRWLAWSGSVLYRAEGALGWAAYHRAAGDLARARQYAERALAHASAPRQPLALLAAHRTLGELATAAGRPADAAAQLDEALALAEACGAPYERALTLLALAELHAAGDRPRATATLAEARAILEPLGARPALDRAAALAARLDAAPAALPFGLTAREAEVLRLVAEGLPDAAVAGRLFVSRATVSTHLRAIYGKLGVTSRTAAARVAAEHGLR